MTMASGNAATVPKHVIPTKRGSGAQREVKGKTIESGEMVEMDSIAE